MHISPTNSGFNKWSTDYRSNNDNDDNPGGATPVYFIGIVVVLLTVASFFGVGQWP